MTEKGKKLWNEIFNHEYKPYVPQEDPNFNWEESIKAGEELLKDLELHPFNPVGEIKSIDDYTWEECMEILMKPIDGVKHDEYTEEDWECILPDTGDPIN